MIETDVAPPDAFPDVRIVADLARGCPEEMTHDNALQAIRARGLDAMDVAWICASYELRKPRVRTATVTDTATVREFFGDR